MVTKWIKSSRKALHLPAAQLRALNWYAVMVRAGQEFAVEALLERRGLVAIVPMITQWRRVNRFVKRKHQVQYPLLARYVLVGFEGAPRWDIVFGLTMVQSVVGVGEVPWRMQGRQVAKFLIELGEVVAPEEQRHMATHHEFAEGDEVEVIGTAYDGHVVRVHRIEGAAARLLLPLFGTQMEVQVPLANLVKSA